jgi:hypothetical protein
LIKQILICFFIFLLKQSYAQFNICIDSGRVNPLFQCNDQFYNPVCGCDGITYRNQCEAYNVYGVTNWRSGVCSGLDVDYYPNPVGPASPFTVNLSFPEFIMGNADLKISDLYGRIYTQRIINNFNRQTIQLDLSGLKTGLYFLIIASNKKTSYVSMFSKF